jgi:hypothetical protein
MLAQCVMRRQKTCQPEAATRSRQKSVVLIWAKTRDDYWSRYGPLEDFDGRDRSVGPDAAVGASTGDDRQNQQVDQSFLSSWQATDDQEAQREEAASRVDVIGDAVCFAHRKGSREESSWWDSRGEMLEFGGGFWTCVSV